MRIQLYTFCLAAFFFSCERPRHEWSDHEAAQYAGKELLKNVNITYSDSGQITVVITAPEMVRFVDASNQKEEFTKGFFAKFYNNQHQLVNTLSSKYAIREAKERKTTMSDSVVFQSVSNETLQSSELIWDEQTGKLSTDKYVKISRKDELVHGYGFETDANFRVGKVKLVDAVFPANKLIDEDVLK